MPSFLEITPDKLNRIIGTPNVPTIIDVRRAECRRIRSGSRSKVQRSSSDGRPGDTPVGVKLSWSACPNPPGLKNLWQCERERR